MALKPNTKAADAMGKPAKQIAHEMLPTRHSMATITKGDPAQRSMNNYAKQTPADANGLGSLGLNMFTMSKGM